jgi:Ca2+-binding RTX toxin-like protein
MTGTWTPGPGPTDGDDVYGGDGTNENIANGGEGNDTIDGAGGDDSIYGGAGNDILLGGDGDDYIEDAAGTTVSIDGGAGADRIRLPISFLSGTVNGGDGADEVIVSMNESNLNISIYTISLGALSFQNVETMTTIGNRVFGTAAQFEAFDSIRFMPNDPFPVQLLLSAPGTLDLSDEVAGRGVYFTGSSGADSVTTSNVRDMIGGGDGDDTIAAGAGDDEVSGEAGADTLDGGDGDDRLVGGAGEDVLTGGDGADLIIDAGIVASINGGAGNDRIDLGTNTFSSGVVDGGGDFDEVLVQGALNGLSFAGVERLFSIGLVTGTAAQFSSFSEITATFEVRLALSAPAALDLSTRVFRPLELTGSSGADNITTSWNSDTVLGLGGNDTINGGDGFNTLSGGDGDDELTTGADADTLIGGAGADSLNGGGGHYDVAQFAAAFSSASVQRFVAGSWSVTSAADGTDTLVNIEYAEFAGRDFSLRPAEGTIDANGTSDILLRSSSGVLVGWTQTGFATTGVAAIATSNASAQTWRGDFNGDGRYDLLMRDASGVLTNWLFDGFSVAGAANYQTDIAFALIGVGDTNGDGADDVVFRESGGRVVLWQMNGLSVSLATSFDQSEPAWSAAGLLDANGDGRDDILFRSPDGVLALWTMSGVEGTVAQKTAIALSDTNYSIAGEICPKVGDAPRQAAFGTCLIPSLNTTP